MSKEYVCYCFEHTADEIRQDVVDHGESQIMAEIMAEKKSGGCHCTTKNPKGR